MGTSPSHQDGPAVPPKKSSTVILLLITMGDTTWRMFVPIIGLMILGLLTDQNLGTRPWIMIVGLTIGVYLAFVLIKRQYNKAKNNDK